MNQLATSTVSMTSLELVEFINANTADNVPPIRHDNLMARAPKVLGGVLQWKDTYTNPQNGQQYPCYRFPKREACLMAMSYSYELQAKVFDRMTDLEHAAVIIAPALPNFMDPVIAARAWADEVEAKKALQFENGTLKAEVVESREAVAFVADYVDADGSMSIRAACKILGIPERRFAARLIADGHIYRSAGGVLPMARHIAAERFTVKAGVSDASGHAYTQTRITPKGFAWLAGIYGSQEEAA